MAWNPEQYRRFAAERAQPFHDLLDLLATERIERAVDLGCGSGELTVAVAERFGITTMVGVDSSPAMLDVARALVTGAAGDGATDAGAAGDGAPVGTLTEVCFEDGDISTWTSSGDHDLVLANASLQWVADHPVVLARWAAALRPGGQLAVQVPANADHASHLASAHVAAGEPFRSAMGGTPPPDPVATNVLAPDVYATVLHDLGLEDVHVRLQVYGHVLSSSADVVEWTRGTSLTRFFARLPDELHEPFVDAYRAELLGRIGHREPYFYPFKRILMRGCSPRGHRH